MSWLLAGGGARHFEQLCSAEHLFASWSKFARGKLSKRDVQNFARNLEANIFELQTDLVSGLYRHGQYQPFVVHDPKRRQIHKASVRDRLIHQAVFDIIEPLFEKRFINDSFSCRKGKGTHVGVNRLRRFLRQASRNDTQAVYALKCDIRQFFASVDHQKLLELLSAKVKDIQPMAVLNEVINSFAVSPGKGIPLGNLTSQLFANIYMHEFDWFVKHQLCEKYYVRYCDDFILVSPDCQQLRSLIDQIQGFLKTELGLELHPSKVDVRSWDQGIDFLGYVLKPHCTLIRTKTKRRILTRANQDNLTSYMGVLSHADSYELQRILLSKLW